MQIQTVELVQRLRRLLGFRGSVQLDVASMASPVILTQDATGIPYRLEGRRWWVGEAAGAPAAGNVTEFQFSMASGVGVVDQLIFVNPGGTGRTHAVRVGNDVNLFSFSRQAYSMEAASDQLLTTTTSNIPVVMEARTGVPGGLGRTLHRVQVPNNASLVVPLDVPVVLYPNGPGLVIQSNVAEAMEVWATGRFFSGIS